MTLLCSKTLFLKQSDDDSTVYHSLGGAWTGRVNKEHFSVSRADGWELVYQANRIAQLRTDSGLLIEWDRAEDGRLLSIRETKNHSSGITLEWGKFPGEFQEVERFT